jgi:hypothetical protein
MIDWTAASVDFLADYGADIISYTILIQAVDQFSFYSSLDYCDGSDTSVIDQTSCEIPISVLLGSPFNLVDSVYAKVAATNVVGNSLYSSVGNGAIITMSYPPDAPDNLLRDEAITSRTVLGFSWTDGASNGGQTIEDYRVSFDQGINSWKVLQSGVLT